MRLRQSGRIQARRVLARIPHGGAPMKTALQSIPPAMLLCAFALSASAQDVAVAAAVEPTTKAAHSTEDVSNNDRIADRHCLRATGSRLVTAQNTKSDKAGRHCAIGPGRVHTSEDLARTGASSLGEALRK